MTELFQLQLSDVKNHSEGYLETIFSLDNGHFGIRASDPITSSPTGGTLVNGYYETNPITYGESAFGYAKNHQTIANLPDLRLIQVTDAEGNKFDQANLLDAKLNFKTGILVQTYRLSTSSENSIILKLTTVISQINQHLAALKYEFSKDSYSGKIKVTKPLYFLKEASNSDDPRKARHVDTLDINTKLDTDDQKSLLIKTQNSHLEVSMKLEAINGKLKNWDFDLSKGNAVATYLAGVSAIGKQAQPNNMDLNLNITNYDDVTADAKAFWTNVWKNSQIEIDGDDQLTQVIRYNLFQLNQSVGRDGITNIAAKGLSGTGYEGHYFWDTEMYLLPYFTYTNPRIAQQLLNFRYNTLNQAKKQARILGVDHGALFPWRTINGEEASAYYPAGSAQYHIDGDIAYAVERYFGATRDIGWLVNFGYELVLETARFWAEFGHRREVNGKTRFEFSGVTGPNEYTVMVDNNYYTNRIAKNNLELAVDLAALIRENAPNKLEELHVSDKELKNFSNIAKMIYLPYDKSLRINAQDDSFLSKPLWPFKSTPKENYPLLLHYHPLTIYRHQVAKQADTILAEFLFPNDISSEQLSREYKYYEAITTHDSSLSRSVFSMVAARLHNTKKAYDYFMDTAKMDLVDMQGNTEDGLHLSNLGGSWLALTAGFAGMTVQDGYLHLQNNLPKQWNSLNFRVRMQQDLFEIKVSHQGINVQILDGSATKVMIDGKWQKLPAKSGLPVNE